MASLIDELIDVLNLEEKEYQDLILLSREKTPVIVKGDLEKLQKITEAEQFVVGKLNKLERRRTEVAKDIAVVLGKEEDELKVPDIIEILASQKAEQERLKEVYDRLKATLKEMVRLNDINKGLIQESLEFIEFNMNLYKGIYQEPETGNYTKSASASKPVATPGVFDAKQ